MLIVHRSCSFVVSHASRKSAERTACKLSSPKEVDVSDLDLKLDDLNAPLPSEIFQGISVSGYQSTSRIPSVQDDACMWTEDANQIQATLAIPGLRGQPPAALSVLFASNTCTVSAFGYAVWSCILRGDVTPESASYNVRDGPDMVPIIELQVDKVKTTNEKLWGGFILQVGEDSIL